MNSLPPIPRRAAIYARVSTGRQAEADLSIPDQLRQAQGWCEQNGIEVITTFVEPGRSGTDESRPSFQAMMTDASAKPRPFDIIVVHSFSRFCRDEFTYATAKRTLDKAGIRLTSITQPLGDDHTGQMICSILTTFDAYQSRENGKHTARAMKENARQGFWNGARPPFGFAIADAEQRGGKTKRKLVVEPDEAVIIQRIFDMYLAISGRQFGIKAIVNQLNGEGVSFRGKPFMISSVHRILTNETLTGRHWFNKLDVRTGERRPSSEWIGVAVPQIIERSAFDRAQLMLEQRRPNVTAPRVVNAPTLLTGLAACSACGAGMTLRTGKGGRYRYYVCAGRAQKGATRCEGCSIPMETLDDIILGALADRVFTADRIEALVTPIVSQTLEAEQERHRQQSNLKGQITEADGAMNRLLTAIEKGLIDLDDPSLKGRMQALTQQRAVLEGQLAQHQLSLRIGRPKFTQAKLDRIIQLQRERLTSGSAEFQRAYLRLFVSKVLVGRSEITIKGPNAALVTAAFAADGANTQQVPSFVRGWRPVRDSNPCYQRERLVS